MSEESDRHPSLPAVCESYLAIENRLDQLYTLSAKAEELLAAKHGWFTLTRVQRRTLPAAQVYYDLEDEVEELQGASSQLVIDLVDMPARSLDEAVAKLEVVARVIEPADYPYAHAVLAGAIKDLRCLLAQGQSG